MDAKTECTTPQTGLGTEFRKLWAASALSNLGDGIWLVAAPLLAAALTNDPALVAGLAFAQRLPWLLFPLISGALADRIDRRKAMVAVAIFRALLIGTLGVAVVSDHISLPLLYAIFFLITTGETLFDTSSVAILPAIVRYDELPKANARLTGTVSVANQFVGLPLGGLLFSMATALPFLLGAGGIAVAAALLTTLQGTFKSVRREDVPRSTLRTEIGEGIRWLWHQRLLRTTALAMGVLNLTLFAQTSIMVLYAEEYLGLDPAGYGILLTAYGIGGVLGSVVAERILNHIGHGTYLRLAVIIEATIPAVIVLSGNAFAVGAVLVLFGVNGTIWGTLLVSLRQQLTPDRLRGRVQSAYGLIENGTAAPATLLGGLLAAQFGLAAPFWFATVVGMLLLPFVWSSFSNAAVAEARTNANLDAVQ